MQSREKSRHVFLYLVVGAAVATLTQGCTASRLENAANPKPSTPALSQSQAAQKTASKNSQVDNHRPETKVVPMNVEGQVTEVELKLFHQPPLPFTTYFLVKDFTPEIGASEEGTGVRFYFSPKGVKDEKAFIHIFLPAQPTSVDGVRDLILGDQGLLATNGWELVDRTDIVSYPWATEKLIYRQPTANGTFVGAIYIGTYNGKAFYTFTHYPIEYGDGFEPRSTIVLENLQFPDEK